VKQILIALVVAWSVAGCVSTRTTSLDGAQGHALQGKSLALTTRAKPAFSAMTPGKAMFGLIGAGAMISAGNRIVADNDIADPAAMIGDQLRQALVERLGFVAATGGGAQVDTTDPALLASLYPGADFLLDVQTVNWSFVYRPGIGTQHYRVIYSVKVRLVDSHAKSLRAEAFCVRNDDGDANPPTHDELLADHAKILKARLAAHASECVGELKQKVLGSMAP